MKKVIALCALFAAWSAEAAVPQSQRDALIAIFNAAGGPNWTDKTGWLGAPGTECDWYGVGCDETQSNVTNLDLYENNLTGTISPEIGKLTKLRDLQLYNNHLTGPIPPEIGQLADLQDLFASNNELSGTIPAQFGALKKLTDLSLDVNHLTGTLPAALGDMTALEEFSFSYNSINGAIPPQLSKLANLTLLSGDINELTGPIPPELGMLSKLDYLSLAGNQLNGQIPPQLGDLPALRTLRLSLNRLQGQIPVDLGRLHALEDLILESNLLTGPIPAALGNLSSLKTLNLATNQLTGGIPSDLYRLAALVELNLGDNKLTGPISADIGKLSNLHSLWLYYNQFDGNIPIALTTIAPLEGLGLQGNALTGPIPPELSRLTNLTRLDLSLNKLTGTLPPQLGSLTKLEGLLAYNNQLEGPIPPELGQLTNLVYLHFANNRLTGAVPDTMRNLTKLQQIGLGSNRLTGPLPSWIGELRQLTDLFIGDNQFTGTLPAGLATLEQLRFLDVGQNFLTGPLPDFTRLTELRFLWASYNQLSGPIPASIGALTNVVEISLNDNALTGTLPREIGKLTDLEYLVFGNNSLEGTIPAELGALKKVYSLSLGGNRFTGTIPPQIGDMSGLQFLDLSFNALRGPVPAEITKLTKLEDHRSSFGWNALFTNDPNVRAFLDLKEGNGTFVETQTVPPANVKVTATTDRSATLTWTPIPYLYDAGGYQVIAQNAAVADLPAVIATTSSKQDDTIVVRNLQPSTFYNFFVFAVTHPHDGQQNLVISGDAVVGPAKTTERILAPPEVVVTEAPGGTVQIDGVEAVSDSFTVTNFGDVGTSVELDFGGEFFACEPATFPIAAGASQIVRIKTQPKQPGTYYGSVSLRGTGVADGTYVDVVLLSVKRPTGTVIAVPISTRIEVAGAPGSDSIGVAQFRNNGTAELSGILVSDQPWVQPNQQPITIAPNTVGSINFRVVRAKRPAGVDGALTANLTLVYVAGSTLTLDTAPVNVSKVTVVDTSKPPVAPGSAPGLAQGEVAFFAAGVSALQRFGGSLGSDVSIFNASPARSVSDLRLYFTAAGTAQSSVATMPSVASAQAVSLVNVVNNVYNAANAVGTLQIRSADWRNLAVSAKLTNARGEGTFTGDVPLFRSDRAAAAGQQIVLTGVRKPSDIYVQEMGGTSANVRVDFLDANGAAVGAPLTPLVGAYGLAELRDAVPAGATTAIVTGEGGGRFGAYARVADEASGDTWSVADWSRINKYATNEAVRVVVAGGGGAPAGGTPGRRRAIPHSIEAQAPLPRAVTDVTLFNPGAAEARAKVQVLNASGQTSEREVIVGAKQTVTIPDAAASASTATAQVVVDPTRGNVVVTARAYRSSERTVGSAVPVLAASSGLRVGQSQTFADLHDSTAATVAAATPATFRTGFGFVETAGQSVTVRARVTIVETRALVAARSTVTRDFQLAPRQQLVLDDLVRSIAGAARETEFGDLHGLQLQIEVVSGGGAVVPFVVVTDNGSGDSLVRLE